MRHVRGFEKLRPSLDGRLKSCADTKLDQELLPCRPHKTLLQMNSASFFGPLARPIKRCVRGRPALGHPVYPSSLWGTKSCGAKNLWDSPLCHFLCKARLYPFVLRLDLSALYQGTTLVGPLTVNKDLGFSP
jgi:hypothetical protein